jgi:hypothetical protein
MSDDGIFATVCRQQRQWSQVADGLKVRITRARVLVLSCSAVGAALQTLSAMYAEAPDVKQGLAVLGTIALGLVPILSAAGLRPRNVRLWLRSRSVSEGLKSELFRFRAGVAPYVGTELERTATLQAKGREIQRWLPELSADEIANVDVQREPVPSGPFTSADYLKERVENQIAGYYARTARENARRMRIFRGLELAFAIAAFVLGTIASATPASTSLLGSWVAVLTTVGGSLMAHAASSKYDHQARSYYATKQQLQDLLAGWNERRAEPFSQDAWATFVLACEECISAENRGWMAKLDPEEQSGGSKPANVQVPAGKAAAPAPPT